MTETTAHQSTTARDDLPALLQQLEEALTQQIALARTDRFEPAGEVGTQVDTLLIAINTHRPEALSTHALAVARIRTLRNTLELAVAQQRDEYSRQRTDMGQGKRLLRAYGRQARTDQPRGSM